MVNKDGTSNVFPNLHITFLHVMYDLYFLLFYDISPFCVQPCLPVFGPSFCHSSIVQDPGRLKEVISELKLRTQRTVGFPSPFVRPLH